MAADEKQYLLALSLIPGLGTTGAHQLIKRFGSASRLFSLSPRQYGELNLSKDVLAWFESKWALRSAEKTAAQVADAGIGVLAMSDPEYPHLLKTIYECPLVLYFRGDVKLLQQPAIAIVGSRRCSVYGRQVTEKLSRQIASFGLVVTSGLARGVDSCAHLGALEVGGRTVAVLGSGVDVVYPKENAKLYDRILQAGCIVSEFPCGTFPGPQNFPIRNRIISGLSYGTLLTEAAEYSGSLITARLTLEQNRQLWAVPGNITSPGSYGPNYLIKQGARVVLDAQDILDELPPYLLAALGAAPGRSAPSAGAKDETDKTPEASSRVEGQLTEPEQKLLKQLPVDSSVHFDTLVRISGFGLQQLNDLLLTLEIKAVIRALPGRHYARKLL